MADQQQALPRGLPGSRGSPGGCGGPSRQRLSRLSRRPQHGEASMETSHGLAKFQGPFDISG